MQQRLTLANGLRVKVTHDPQASRAAALFYLSAGSHHEPRQWPGLAHLFEHVVFAGSNGYRGEQRLMSWAQAEGARLNATTLPTSTAWFFDIAAAKLADGFARLADMLAFPLLSLEAIASETAVIDAEFRLLSADNDILCEAALGAAFVSPRALADFHVGNLGSFGEDTQALQQALRDYHQRYFHADNLTLWLLGPQSCEQLAALAEQYAAVFPSVERAAPPVTAPLKLKDSRSFALKQDGSSRLHLSFALTNTHWQDRPSLSLLRQFFCDEAQHSLLAALCSAGLCDSLQLMVPYCSENGAILSFEFILNADRQATAAQVENLFFAWLRALSQVEALQLGHYANLARKAFARQSPVDRLRANAFGFAEITGAQDDLQTDWNNLLSQLCAATLTRLWISPSVSAGVEKVQGFSLPLAPIDWVAALDSPTPRWAFYPLSAVHLAPTLPEHGVSLLHYPNHQGDGVLMLSPTLGQKISTRGMHILQVALRAIVAQCAHLGGTLSFENIQGQWLLQLSGSPSVLLSTLDALIKGIKTLPAALIAQGERQYQQAQRALQNDIALRCLINQLPRLLMGESPAISESSSLPRLSWQAGLYGGDSVLHNGVSRLLSAFPGEMTTLRPQAIPRNPPAAAYSFATTGADAAVLLFCPLVEQTAACHAAWRILASILEPRFFQRMRVEKNIGYAVACRFTLTAGQYGLLFAVQSPSHSVTEILQQIRHFIGEMTDIIRHLPQEVIKRKRADLRGTLNNNFQDPLEQTREHWLSQHAYAPQLTSEAISALAGQRLLAFYTALTQEPEHWWILNNQREVKNSV
jgi:coenzyme PQQ biosynthesis probable peptidase PqqF